MELKRVNDNMIKGEIWIDIHRITGTEGYSGSTIIETDIDKKEKTYHLINNKPELLKQNKQARGK